ncbi:MAG: hypothetical protein HZB99_04600 [Candidatus Harrisonbacteria bacterium]|nr:hypothetical protein [Candidatus Harrisonbacteria bacterium]
MRKFFAGSLFVLLFTFLFSNIAFAVQPYCLGPWITEYRYRDSGGLSADQCYNLVNIQNSGATIVGGYALQSYSVDRASPHCETGAFSRVAVLDPGGESGTLYCPKLSDSVQLSASGANLVSGNTYQINQFGSFAVSWNAPFALSCNLSGNAPFGKSFGGEFDGRRSSIIGTSETYRDVPKGIYRFEFACSGYKDNQISPDIVETRKGVTVFSGPVTYPQVSFSIEPTAVIRGEPTKLIWTSENVKRLTLDGASVALSGEKTVTKTTEGTFTFKMVGYGESELPPVTVEKTLTVLPYPRPQINFFKVIPGSINKEKGESAILQWETENTNSVTIIPDPDPSKSEGTSGFVEISPRLSTNYRLTAYSKFADLKEASATAYLETIYPKLEILSFDIDRDSIFMGEGAFLSWRTKNVTAASLKDSDGRTISNQLNGSVTVNPLKKTTYTLFGTGKFDESGEIEESKVLNVSAPVLEISSFAAGPSPVIRGEKVTFAWVTKNIKFLAIRDETRGRIIASNIDPALGKYTLDISPSSDTEYILIGTGEFLESGSTRKSFNLKVNLPPAPIIKLFEITPQTIVRGREQKITIKWETENAEFLTIKDGSGRTINLGTDFDKRADQVDIVPPPTIDTSYTIIVRGKFIEQGEAKQTKTVEVNLPGAPNISSFTANPPAIIKGGKSILRWSAENAVSLTIRDDRGIIIADKLDPGINEIEVRPDVKTQYSLTAYPQFTEQGTDRKFATVDVSLPSGPQITSFTSEPSAIVRGTIAKVILKWQAQNVSSIIIRDQTRSITLEDNLDPKLGQLEVNAPTSDTTYAITGLGLLPELPSAKSSFTLKVFLPQIQVNFSLDKNLITRGDKVNLKWDTVNAESILIKDNIGRIIGRDLNPAAGEILDRPATDVTSYTLTATGEFLESKPIAKSVAIKVNPPQKPTITLLELNPPKIIRGQKSILKWESVNAIVLDIKDDHGQSLAKGLDPQKGEIEVAPKADTVYTITVSGALAEAGSDQETILLDVRPPTPEITYFKVEPGTIVKGEQKAMLKWQTKNTSSVSVKDGAGKSVGYFLDAAMDEVEVVPDLTTKYTLTAKGETLEAGEARQTVILNVALPGSPQITSFSVNPESVLRGNGATLSWETKDGISASLSPEIGRVDLSGSVDVKPIATTEYILTVAGKFEEQGVAKESVILSVTLPDGPRITSFKIEPEKIKKGESATLNWSTENATSVLISPGIGPVRTTGTMKVSPSITTRYTITAQGKFKESGEDKRFMLLKVEEALPFTPVKLPEIIEEEKEKEAEASKPAAKPVIDLKVNGQDGPLTIAAPATLNLSWNLDAYCLVYGSWIGVKNRAGQDRRVESKPGTYTYKIYCPTIGSDEVSVNVVRSRRGGAGVGGEGEVALPFAEASVSKDSKNFQKRISVIHGEPVGFWFGAAYDTDGDNLASRDETDGWTRLMSSGGRCDWNTDLNQGEATFEITGSSPKNPEQCTYYLGELTFNDEPGIYSYEVLRLVQNDGKVSNIASVEVEVLPTLLPPGPPEIDLRINNLEGPVTLGAPADYNVTWNVKNADSCTSSGSWGGDKSVGGSQHFVSSEKKDFIYTLTCTGKLGTTSKSISLKVAELPVCDFSALPTVISLSSFERQSVLTWKCQFANSCSISPGVDIDGKTFGSIRVSPAETTKYTLVCQNFEGSSGFGASVEVR